MKNFKELLRHTNELPKICRDIQDSIIVLQDALAQAADEIERLEKIIEQQKDVIEELRHE